MGDQFIPPEVMDQVGMEFPIKTLEVEKGAIRKFAEAIGDENPQYHDEEYARARYGRLVAPPTFITTLTMGLGGDVKWDFGRVGLHGGEEYEYFKPIKAGDTLTCKTRVADIYEKQGRKGPMAFMVIESRVTNQDGELVAKMKRTRIRMS
jgi:acyl dehydratase